MAKKKTSAIFTLIKASALAIACWAIGLLYFTTFTPKANYDTDAIAKLDTANGIVVLTGGNGRLETGLLLLENQKADQLFLSGVNPVVSMSDLTRLTGAPNEMFDCCVQLDHASSNTIENAVTSTEWVRGNDYQSFYLVTSSYHMRRSMMLFKDSMPDITIIPAPVETDASIIAIINEYNKYLFTAVRLLF